MDEELKLIKLYSHDERGQGYTKILRNFRRLEDYINKLEARITELEKSEDPFDSLGIDIMEEDNDT